VQQINLRYRSVPGVRDEQGLGLRIHIDGPRPLPQVQDLAHAVVVKVDDEKLPALRIQQKGGITLRVEGDIAGVPADGRPGDNFPARQIEKEQVNLAGAGDRGDVRPGIDGDAAGALADMDIRGNPAAGKVDERHRFLFFIRDHREVQFRIDRHAPGRTADRQFPDHAPGGQIDERDGIRATVGDHGQVCRRRNCHHPRFLIEQNLCPLIDGENPPRKEHNPRNNQNDQE